jgi:ribonuclease J
MELGHLRAPAGIFADLSNLSELYPEQVCIITTGSQGEPLSALTRMAFGDHKQVHIQKGDTVILSSKFIPGNETAIHRIINHLYRRGAEVYYETVSEIHVSGHASKQELILMLQLVKPKYFMPIHGETRHLVKHSQLATSLGIPEENILLAHNGDVIEFVGGKGRIVGKTETGRVFIDGKGVGDVGEVVLRDRRHLSENGMVIAIVVIQSITGEIVYGPDISTRGVTYEEEFPDLISEAKAELKKLFNDLPELIKTDIIELKAEVHRTLRRFFNRKLERRPVILPLVIEL